jgi:hypothetical protein
MRVEQPRGIKGSLKWMQRSVAERWPTLEQPILAKLPGARAIDWRSPLESDAFAEYRDTSWLRVMELDRLSPGLASFWPARGPQWDALALTDTGVVLLCEAKAHIDEFVSPPSQASPASRSLIDASILATAAALGVPEQNQSQWLTHFYQYANRLAHLWWLRENEVDAKLVLIGFVGDREMPGMTTPEAWEAAYLIADRILGLPKRHVLSRHIIHVYPRVDASQSPA